MIDKLRDKWKPVEFIETPKDRPSDCDGFLSLNNTIVGLYESKCRYMKYEVLKDYGSWIITKEKVDKCKQLSQSLKIPFLGFLYLVPDDMIFFWKITDENGEFLFEFETRFSSTQKTINGGTIKRFNSYMPLEHAKSI